MTIAEIAEKASEIAEADIQWSNDSDCYIVWVDDPESDDIELGVGEGATIDDVLDAVKEKIGL